MLTKNHITAIIGIAVVAWAASLYFAGEHLSASWFKPFSTVCGIVVFALSLADKYLWRLKWLRPWLFNMPDLRGTWRVAIRPTAPEQSPQDIEAFMVVRQTLSTISLRLYTAESHSETMSARVVRCDDGTCNLAAVYRNTPKLQVRGHSPLHHGALLLSIQGDPPASLAGQYWTDRLSQGDLLLDSRRTSVAHSFGEAKAAMTAASSSAYAEHGN